MTTPRKPRDIIGDLFGGSNADQESITAAEVDTELAEAGIDVPAFMLKVSARIKEVEEAERFLGVIDDEL